MAQVRELPDSRNFDISPDAINFETKWIVSDVINEVEAELALLAASPPIYRRLVRQKLKAEELVRGVFLCTVPYGNIDPQRGVGATPFAPQPPGAQTPLNGINGPKFSFDTTGETKHITQSLATRSASTVQSSGTADIDNANAIGVSADSVQGCDVPIPKFDFTIEIPIAAMSLSYLIALYCISGTVNYAQRFAGFEKGEILYRGANGNYTADDKWNVTHHFSAKPNRKDVKISGAYVANIQGPATTGTIKVPLVCGWDYLWCEYVSAVIGTRMLQVPKKAYVEVVIPTGDFSILTGGPSLLNKKLLANSFNPADVNFYKDMSEKIKQVVRFDSPQQIVGSVVEWSWSDPTLPD